jgi:hypothetical protein
MVRIDRGTASFVAARPDGAAAGNNRVITG